MRKIFKVDGDFGAFYAAEKWIKENGWSLGSMERDWPIGIAKGESIHIPKWCHCQQKECLDGVIADGSKRSSDVTVIIFDDVDKKGIYK